MKRKVFYSFHFNNDCWRTHQVRNIGVVEREEPVSKNDWENIKRKGDKSIKNWIEENLKYKNCTIVLIGSETYSRPWVIHEIVRSWELGKGILGINIHKLKDNMGYQSEKGPNPFNYIIDGGTNKKLSTKINVYEPNYSNSKDVYNCIADNIEDWVEDAIEDSYNL